MSPSPATLSNPAPDASRPAPQAKAAPAVMLQPFTRSAHEHTEPILDNSTLITAASTQLGPLSVPAFGYLRSLLVLVEATGGAEAGGGAVAFNADGPFNALNQIQLTDVNGVPLVGPVGGYDLMLVNKWGGYSFTSDPRNSPAYTAVSGVNASGNFSYLMRIPVEITARDALGALPNQNASSTYKLSYTVNPSATIYSVAPTTKPTVRVRVWLEAWTQPLASDLRGNPQATVPPAMGTTQFWSKATYNVSAGSQDVTLARVGNLIRSLIFVTRNAAGARIDNSWPDPVQIQWDSRILNNEAELIRRQYMYERFGFGPTVGDAAAGIDTGVYVYDYIHDLTGHAGDELRDLYLPTTQATRLEVVGSVGIAGTLDVLTCDVAPVADIAVA